MTSLLLCICSHNPWVLFSSVGVSCWMSPRVRHTQAGAAAHPLEFEVSRCRTYKFARPFLPTQVRMWNSLPYAVFDTLAEPWMGWRVQSTGGCFPELCCLQFFVAQVLVGLRKQLLNNFVFPTWACAADFNNNINLLFHIGLQAIANYGPTHKGYEDLIGYSNRTLIIRIIF